MYCRRACFVNCWKNKEMVSKMLEMNLDGTELKFEVKKYHPSTKNNWDCEWCFRT